MLMFTKVDVSSTHLIVCDSKYGKSRDLDMTIRAKIALKKRMINTKDEDNIFN